MAEICKTFEKEQEQVAKKKTKIFRPVVLRDPAHWQAAHAAYIAGRESMRQEIIPLVYGWCESDNVAQRTVEAIRKIEA